MDNIELHNRLTPGWLLIVAVKLGLGLLMAGAGLIGLGRGNTTGAAWTALAAGAGALGFGLYDLRLLLDHKVQLTLTPEGILDHRMRRPLLLPWSAVTAILQEGSDGHTVLVTVRGLDVSRYTGPGTARSPISGSGINIQLDHVAVSHAAFTAAVHRFAPHVVMSDLMHRPRDGKA